MKKSQLDKLIRKALKEEKQLLNENHWCGCPTGTGAITQVLVSTCPGGCSTCCDGGFHCNQTEEGCYNIDPLGGPTRGPGRKKPTITNRQDTRKTRKGMPSVPTMPHGGGFGPGGIPTKPVNENKPSFCDDPGRFRCKDGTFCDAKLASWSDGVPRKCNYYECCELDNIGDRSNMPSGITIISRGSRGGSNYKGKTKMTPSAPRLREAEIVAGESNTEFKLKVDVSNKQSETKLGVRIQLTPKGGMLEPDVRDKVEIAVTKKLNNALEQFDMQVSKDTDVPNPEVLGFFIPLSQIKNMIVKSIKGGPAQTTGGASTPPKPPTGATPPKPPTPPAKPADDKKATNEMIEDMISEAIISEMRVRDLKEISKVVLKEDFYAFINAGNNVLRTLEEKGIDRGKKYLEYLVKHNIM